MKVIEHPSHWLDKRLVDKIRSTAPEAELMGQLHPDQLNAINRERWLRMLVPRQFVGLELSIPEVLKIEEALAWTDGSVGWVVTLCAGAAWFVGFLDTQVAREVFADDQAFFAGSGAITGVAEIVPEGFLLNGGWKYASGSLHANIFTANFIIHEKGKPVLDSKGNPIIRAFLMKKNEVIVLKTWNSIGMVATASHSFEVKNRIVPANRSFEIDSTKTLINNATYRYPFLQLAETTLTVNLSGLATRFIDLMGELISEKKRSDDRASKLLEAARKNLSKYRTRFYQAANSSWKNCERKKAMSKAELQKVSKASHELAKHSLQIVDQLYPLCGLSAADKSHEINRVWRNIHTASQHSLFKW